MALNISATAIRNPIPPIVLFIALVLGGALAFNTLPITQFPNIETPMLQVSVYQSGAAPEELETQVTQRVESALTAVQGVHRVTSQVSPGASVTTVELNFGTDLSRALEDARQAIARIRADLPADVLEPVVQRLEFTAQPIAYIAVQAPGMTERELSWFVENDVARELLAIPGVSAVSRVGGVSREIRVELDPDRLLALGITADQVSAQMRAQNVDLPGGRAQVGSQAQSIRTLGGAETVEELASSRIVLPTGAAVRLDELGSVTDSASESDSIARSDDQPVVSMNLQKAKGASEVHVYERVKERLAELSEERGATFKTLYTSVDFIAKMHESSIHALLEGAALAVLVVFLFLRDLRATIICAVAIPLAVIPTFLALQAIGFTLNFMTLIALSLVAGVLVDDAIVEIENIVRHMRMGKSPFAAAIEAADEIGLAVVATSATIIAVFLPVGFMEGETGQWFKEFGITVAIAVFWSLVVARLITPLMAAYLMSDHEKKDRPLPFMGQYMKALKFSVRRPAITAVLGFVVFAASVFSASLLKFTFIPPIDEGVLQVSMEFPPGLTLQEGDQAARKLTAELSQDPEVTDIFSSVQGDSGAASQATLFINLTPRSERDLSFLEIRDRMRPILAAQPNVRAYFNNTSGPGGADITVDYVGDDPARVEATAEALAAKMRAMPGLVDVKTSASLKRPEIQIRPRPDEAARLGVSAADLASAVRIATNGDVDQNLAKYTLSDRQVPIRVLLRPDARADMDNIRALRVRSSFGEPVRLDAVADVTFGVGDSIIQRRDRQRQISVTANVAGDNVGAMTQQVMALEEARTPPEGVRLLTSGNTEDTSEMFSSFGGALLWGVTLMYLVLVLLFKNFFHPITIMVAPIMSVGGAVLGLLIVNQPLSLFVLVGGLLLIGIVAKNSILLVDYAIEMRRHGMDRDAALIEAGVQRARPIVMTTFAMSAGMLPTALGLSVDGALRQGMGWAVIGGLLFSTGLSLIFVPAFYIMIDRVERLVNPLFARLSTHKPQEAAAQHAAE